MRSWAVVAVLGLVGCSRIRANEAPIPLCGATSCGATVAVTTSLPAAAKLTDSECASVCANVWCGQKPFTASPGCTLNSSTEVWCGSTAADCGETLGPRVRAVEPPLEAGQCTTQPCREATVAIVAMGLGSTVELHDDECDAVCANVWCGSRSNLPSPGCTMTSLSEVRCAALNLQCEADGGPVQACEPDAGADCTSRSVINFCPRAEAQTLDWFCPVQYSLRRFTCAGGAVWSDSLGGTGPNIECVYADGGLVGGTYENDHGNTYRTGKWALEGCQPDDQPCAGARTCEPSRDGGHCTPLGRMSCESDVSRQQAVSCADQANPWTFATCDGQRVRWMQPVGEFGATTLCIYETDGGLSGASLFAAQGVDMVAGAWDAGTCVVAAGCP